MVLSGSSLIVCLLFQVFVCSSSSLFTLAFHSHSPPAFLSIYLPSVVVLQLQIPLAIQSLSQVAVEMLLFTVVHSSLVPSLVPVLLISSPSPSSLLASPGFNLINTSYGREQLRYCGGGVGGNEAEVELRTRKLLEL